MINDIFERVKPSIGKALYADDGAVWKRGRHLGNVVKGIQESINEVERWSVEGIEIFGTKDSIYGFYKEKENGTNDFGII